MYWRSFNILLDDDQDVLFVVFYWLSSKELSDQGPGIDWDSSHDLSNNATRLQFARKFSKAYLRLESTVALSDQEGNMSSTIQDGLCCSLLMRKFERQQQLNSSDPA